MSAALSRLQEPELMEPEGAPRDLASGNPDRFSALLQQTQPKALTGDRLLAAEALRLLMRLDGDLLEARAQWNQDWFRRLMHARPKAVRRLQRRWEKVDPPVAIPLGSLRRRYHANLAKYLYHSKQ